MSVKVDWYNPEKTIITLNYSDLTEWEDHVDAIRQAYRMMDEVGHPANLISHKIGRKFPSGNPIQNVMNLYRSPNVTDHIIVYVDAPTMVKAIIKIYGKLYPVSVSRNFFVATLEEAVTLCNAHQPPK